MSTVIRLVNSIIIFAALASCAVLLASRCTPVRKVSGGAHLASFVLPAEAAARLGAVREELFEARCSSRSHYSASITDGGYLSLAFPSEQSCLRVRH